MKLIFAYNSDAGFFNTILDVSHKIFSPHTYSCKLCELTHGYLTARHDWTQFISELENTLNVKSEFIHRDEFMKLHYIMELELPVILKDTNGKVEILLSRNEIEALHSVSDLIGVLKKKLHMISS